MKKLYLVIIVLCILFTSALTSCGQYTADSSVDNNDRDDVTTVIQDDITIGDVDYSSNNNDADIKVTPVRLAESIFLGEGQMVITGGDDLDWYYLVFGGPFINSIPYHYMLIAGYDAFIEWKHQFEGLGSNGWRNRREATLRTFVEDFSISMEEMIRIEEEISGLPIEEIDALVTWARNMDISLIECDDEAWEVALWAGMRSLQEIEALVADDIYFVWEVFPGSGVIQNGRVYSPEWILNNMDMAIMEEQIPFHAIERIIEYAGYHPHLDAIRITAENTLQAAR